MSQIELETGAGGGAPQRDQPVPGPRIFRLLRDLLLPALAIFTALLISSFFIIISDTRVLAAWTDFFAAPGEALRLSLAKLGASYGALLQGAFGDVGDILAGLGTWLDTGEAGALTRSLDSLDRSLVNTVPYVFGGLAVALGFRCGLLNIGVEGQLFVGALASAFVGYSLTGLPWYLHLPLALLAGAVAGGIWAGIAGALKAWTGAHEVVTTIMLNYIAFRLADFLLTGPMMRPGFVPITPTIEPTARLPQLLPGLRFHAGFLLALLAAFLVYWLLFKTTLGFEIRTVGANPSAARYAGMSINRNFILAMFLSGALAGLAGTNEVLGVNYNMAQAFSSGYGFDSIALALLGKSHPVGVVLASLLWGFLRAGATRMQSAASIPIDIIQIVQGLIIVFVAAPAVVRWLYRIPVEREAGQAVFTRGWGK